MASFFDDIPDELLDLIIKALCNPGDCKPCFIKDDNKLAVLAKVGATSERFRNACLPNLYRTFDDGHREISQQTIKLIRTFLENQDLTKFVRKVDFCAYLHRPVKSPANNLNIFRGALDPLLDTPIYRPWIAALSGGCCLAQYLFLIYLSKQIQSVTIAVGRPPIVGTWTEWCSVMGFCTCCPDLGDIFEAIFAASGSRSAIEHLFLDGSRCVADAYYRNLLTPVFDSSALRISRFAKNITLRGFCSKTSPNTGLPITYDLAQCQTLQLMECYLDPVTLANLISSTGRLTSLFICYDNQNGGSIDIEHTLAGPRITPIDTQSLENALARHADSMTQLEILTFHIPFKLQRGLGSVHSLHKLRTLFVDEELLRCTAPWNEVSLRRDCFPTSLQYLHIYTHGSLDQFSTIVHAIHQSLPSGLRTFRLWAPFRHPTHQKYRIFAFANAPGHTIRDCGWQLTAMICHSMSVKLLTLWCCSKRARDTGGDFREVLRDFANSITIMSASGPSIRPLFERVFKLGWRINCGRTERHQRMENVVDRLLPCTLARLEGMVPA